MKILISLCASILIAVTVLNFLPINGEEKIYKDTVRLHVIAKSDSEEDQSLKLKVRDAVLSCISEELSDVTDSETACNVLRSLENEIKAAAEKELDANGAVESVNVVFGVENYPTRYYEGFTLPAGAYNSLRVTIGEGQGHNWWCMLFPSVCITDAVETKEDYVAAGFTPEQYKIIDNSSGKKYKVRFKILEILADFAGVKY